MIRYPLIEARFQSTPWCATPAIIASVFRAFQRSSDGIPSAVQGIDPALPAPTRVSGAASSGTLSVQPLGTSTEERAVAVIPVFGVIGKYLSTMESMCGGFDLVSFERTLRAAANDKSISDIVLHFGTPGGSVHGVPEAASLIAQVGQHKAVYGFTDQQMCSAGMWLGSACTSLFCSDFASVGSVGVYLAWIDESKAMEAEGLELKLFKDGTFKASTLPGQLTTEAGQLLQAEVDAIGSAFRDFVRSSRASASGATVSDETMQGQTHLGRDAVSLGLVDGNCLSINDLLLDILSQYN